MRNRTKLACHHGRSLLAVLVATVALVGIKQSLAPSSASALIVIEDEDCLACDGSWGSDGDQQDSASYGGDSSDGWQADQDDDGETEYERDHRQEIEELDEEISNDTEWERGEEREFDARVAEEELRQIDEEEDALLRGIEYSHNETREERIARERADLYRRHPELGILREECESLEAEAILLFQRQAQPPTDAERAISEAKIREILSCRATLAERSINVSRIQPIEPPAPGAAPPPAHGPPAPASGGPIAVARAVARNPTASSRPPARRVAWSAELRKRKNHRR